MRKSKVAVLFTSPTTVIEDIKRVIKLAEFESYLPKNIPIILKVNISWHYWMPGCSTTPWQLDGVVATLLEAHYKDLVVAQNRTVVVDPKLGEKNNNLISVRKKYNLDFVYLYEPEVEWISYEPQGKILVLDKVFGKQNIKIPKFFIGKSAFHLPTLKTHVFTTITGAMKNAFGGLLQDNRHWTHSVIHETLVDLLRIQKEIHPGIFALTDGTIAGSGPGPRALQPHVKNILLASGDSVAIDAVAAKIMGFDPESIKFIKLATEEGLGCGDLSKIEIVGDDISNLNFSFKVGDTLASRGQKLIYWGILSPFEHLLLRTRIVPWAYFASRLYYDFFWYPLVGKRRANKILRRTAWGKLFQDYA